MSVANVILNVSNPVVFSHSTYIFIFVAVLDQVSVPTTITGFPESNEFVRAL